MTELEDKINLDETVFDGIIQERKFWSCLGQTCSRSLIVSVPTVCDFVDHLWMLLENSSFKNL